LKVRQVWLARLGKIQQLVMSIASHYSSFYLSFLRSRLGSNSSKHQFIKGAIHQSSYSLKQQFIEAAIHQSSYSLKQLFIKAAIH
jgi:hypothetical protein